VKRAYYIHLKSIQFHDIGHALNGGALYVDSCDVVTMVNLTNFTACTASLAGGMHLFNFVLVLNTRDNADTA
jgi:hypothetical protein